MERAEHHCGGDFGVSVHDGCASEFVRFEDYAEAGGEDAGSAEGGEEDDDPWE